MCVRLMGKIFDNSDLPPGERFTLLALADHADDSGRCFPSIARLAKGTGYSERAIQGHLKTLERRGVVKVAKGAGPNGVNVFAISLPPADFAPKPSGTTKEPSDISSKAEDAVSIIARIAGQEAAKSFAAYRRQMKKPLSLTAARRLVKALSQIEAEGGNAADALGMAEERGWQTVKPDWYFSKSKHEQNERLHHPASQRRDKPLRAASAGDAFAERLAFVGSNRGSPQTDWGFG